MTIKLIPSKLLPLTIYYNCFINFLWVYLHNKSTWDVGGKLKLEKLVNYSLRLILQAFLMLSQHPAWVYYTGKTHRKLGLLLKHTASQYKQQIEGVCGIRP